MAFKSYFRAGLGILAGFGAAIPAVRAVDVDVNVGVGVSGPPREVIVQPAPTVTRRWIPDQVIHKEERVVVEPARIEKREERVLVEPAHIERIKEQRLIREAHVEKQWVPAAEDASVRIGPVRIEGTVREGYWREVHVPAQYETVYKDIQYPAKYQTVIREVRVPERYQLVNRDVVIPGHWEETTVAPPPTVVVEPRHNDVELDIDFFRKRKHN